MSFHTECLPLDAPTGSCGEPSLLSGGLTPGPLYEDVEEEEEKVLALVVDADDVVVAVDGASLCLSLGDLGKGTEVVLEIENGVAGVLGATDDDDDNDDDAAGVGRHTEIADTELGGGTEIPEEAELGAGCVGVLEGALIF